jgi:hypothetical protein
MKLRKANSNDIFVIGMLFLGFLLVCIPLGDLIGAQPPTILSMALAGLSGTLLSSIGIKISQGLKPTLIIGIVTTAFAVAGYLLGSGLLILVNDQ